MSAAESIARAFHETYERLAPEHGWETQQRSRTSWEDVPEENKRLMVATAQHLLDKHVIVEGAAVLVEAMYGHDHPRGR